MMSLVHVAVHRRYREVAGMHLLSQPIDFPSGIAEDDGLGNGQSFVKITESIQLPFLFFYADVELLDTLECKLLLLD